MYTSRARGIEDAINAGNKIIIKMFGNIKSDEQRELCTLEILDVCASGRDFEVHIDTK